MKYQYKTQGTCSRLIDIEVENGVVTDIIFTGDAMATCREFRV